MPERITVWLTDEQSQVIKLRASELGLTKSQLLRCILDKELATGGPVIDQGWRAGFAHGYASIMAAVQTSIRDVERRMQAGEIVVPQVDMESAVEDMNG